MISLTVWRWLSENMMMRKKKMIIYSHLNKSRKLVFKKEENNVTVKILIDYIIENHNLKHVKTV